MVLESRLKQKFELLVTCLDDDYISKAVKEVLREKEFSPV